MQILSAPRAFRCSRGGPTGASAGTRIALTNHGGMTGERRLPTCAWLNAPDGDAPQQNFKICRQSKGELANLCLRDIRAA